jgi:hypothetical protein
MSSGSSSAVNLFLKIVGNALPNLFEGRSAAYSMLTSYFSSKGQGNKKRVTGGLLNVPPEFDLVLMKGITSVGGELGLIILGEFFSISFILVESVRVNIFFEVLWIKIYFIK